jgi:hypothetical protein
MASGSVSRVLILYSNPADTARLRLDKEHRAVEGVLERANLPNATVRRLHAASVDDIAMALKGQQYEILQFSGHGSPGGFYLESARLDTGELLSPERAAALLRLASPDLKAALFLSCFSASSISHLIEVAPYLITISCQADDDAAIQFVTAFYDSYFRQGSIEQAFSAGLCCLDYLDKGQDLKPVLSRRAQVKGSTRTVIQVFPTRRGDDTLLIDVTEAERAIAALGIARDDFLFLLTRKLRVHRWVFDFPKERALLSIGPYFGTFSWQNAADLVTCHEIMKLRSDVDEETCEAWALLILLYNDLWCSPYRSPLESAPALDLRKLERAVEDFLEVQKRFFEDERRAALLRVQVPDQFKAARALLNANLDLAEGKLHKGEHESTVMYLETALSVLHDLVDALATRLLTKVTVRPDRLAQD